MKTSIDFARSIRHASLVIMISAVSAVQACSSDTTPTGPSSVTREPVAGLAQLRVFGTVTDDDGAPVSGVIVTVYRWAGNGQPVSAISDSRGFYSILFPSGAGISIFTQKEGYVSAWHSDKGAGGNGFENARGTDFEWDLRIYRVVERGEH